MDKIFKILRITGYIMLAAIVSYFINLYTDFTRLLVVLGLAGVLIFESFLYIYKWMIVVEEERNNRKKEIDKALDLTLDYARDIEKKVEVKKK